MATLTNVNDKIIAQRALQGLVDFLAPLSAFSTSYSDEAKNKGDTVVVPLVGTLSATTFNQNYEVGGGTLTAVTVSINQHKIVPLSLTDVQYANSSVAQIEAWGYQAGQALGNQIIGSVWTLITSGAPGYFATGYTYPVASWNAAKLVALRQAMSVAKVPMDNRSLFLDPTSYGQMLTDTSVAYSSYYGNNKAITEGQVPRVYGFDIRESNLIPVTDTMYGFAVHPSALAVAVRALTPQAPSEYLSAGVVSQPETGVSIGFRKHYSPSSGTLFMNFEALYGSTVGITACLSRIAYR
jgi:hypothetical protein